MAIDLSFLGGIPEGLLTAEQQTAAQDRARQAAALQLGLGMIAGAQGQRGAGKPGLAQIIGQAGPGAIQAYQSSFDQTLKNALTSMQFAEMKRRQAQEQANQQAMRSLAERMGGVTPQGALAVPEGQVGPTIDRAAMIGQQRPITGDELIRLAFSENLSEDTRRNLLTAAQMVQPKEGPGIIGEFQAAKRQGLISEEMQLSDYIALKKPPAPSATAIAGGEVSPFAKKAQELQATEFSNIKTSGNSAQRTLQQINKLDDLLKKSGTGLEASAKQFAGQFGINTRGLSEIQAAQSIINQLVPQQRPPGSGTMSDADLALFKQSLPRIINQPGGNKIIIDTLKDVNTYLVKEGQIAGEVLNGKITPEEGYNRLLNLANPLEKFKGGGGGGLEERIQQELQRRQQRQGR